jgi:hypothetical protein
MTDAGLSLILPDVSSRLALDGHGRRIVVVTTPEVGLTVGSRLVRTRDGAAVLRRDHITGAD